ncbi:MAG: rhomboid family intramembrane serine protease [Xanthomonadales bacterium]|nr:rhomboid family intramembrane serine protease [Xanthomonadales bacterium]
MGFLREPDPEFLTSRRTHANFNLAWKLALAFLVVLWGIHLLNWLLGYELNRFGILPRQGAGLVGIVAAPLLHGGFGHLVSNSLPLLVGTTGILFLYPNAAVRVVPVIYLGAGAAVWAVGRPVIHIGASGLVYGLLAFLFLSGIVKRDTRGIALSLLIYFLYGSLVWGVFPIRIGVSWESHLAGGIIGAVLAVRFRRWDLPPRKRYSWEDEDE